MPVSRPSDHFQVALSAAGMHTWTWDVATNVVDWSDGIESLVGLAPGSFGRTFEAYQRVLHPADRPLVLAAIEAALASDGAAYEIEHRVGLPDGSTRWLACRGQVQRNEAGAPVSMLGVVWDVTARKQAEARIVQLEEHRSEAERGRNALQAQLLRSDRLAAIGRLAGGVAHEINNPMAYVVLNLELAAKKVTELDPASPAAAVIRDAIDQCREGAERVRRIVRGLGAFSRGDDEPMSAVDVHRALDAALTMTENRIRHSARLVREYRARGAVLANEFRLVQVFVNLLVNAADAIAGGDVEQNEIRVTTAHAPSGVVVTIADSGSGIAPEARAHLFEPFFTTKPVGAGTGLGLSICHTIVTGFGGTITVDDRPGPGATFRVVLPSADRAAATPHAPAAPRASRRARILVVDDEAPIAHALASALSSHDVTIAASGHDARERCATTAFDCVVCDVMMPDLSGADLHEHLRRDGRGLERRIVFMTGGAFAPREKAFLASVPNRCVEKPFEVRALEDAVRAVLGDEAKREGV